MDVSEAVFTMVTVTMINDAPVLQIGDPAQNAFEYNTTFTEDGSAVAVVDATNIVISDDDHTTLTQLSINLSNVHDPGYETLFFDFSQLPVSVDQSKILSDTDLAAMNFQQCPPSLAKTSVTITQDYTLEEWTEILKVLYYCNDDKNATAGGRDVAISLTDPDGVSTDICHSYIEVEAVNDPPTLVGVLTTEYTIEEDHNLTMSILPAFLDHEEDLTSENIVIASFPQYGTIAVSGDNINYYPAFNDFGNYTLSFRICDKLNACTPVIEISIEVQSVNDPPFTVQPLQVNVKEDQSIEIDLKQFVRDYEDDLIVNNSYPLVTYLVGPFSGSKVVSADNRFVVFTPSANFYGQDNIMLTYCDNDDECLQYINIPVYVESVNDLPTVSVIYPDLTTTFRSNEDESLYVEIMVEDLEDRTPGVITILSVGHGTAEHNSTSQSAALLHNTVYQFTTHIVYTPDVDYNGLDSVLIGVCDLDGGCVNETINIEVLAVNDPPIIGQTILYIDEDEELVVSMPRDLNITDTEEILDYTNIYTTGNVSVGNLTGYRTPLWTYKPQENFFSINSDDVVFSIEVCDTDLLDQKCTVADIQIVIRPINDAPITPHIHVQIDEDGGYALNLSEYITDVEDGVVQFDRIAITDVASYLVTAVYDSTLGVLALQALSDIHGSGQVLYSACDSENLCSNDGVIDITVINVNDPPTADDFTYNASQDELQLIHMLDFIHDIDIAESEKIVSLQIYLIDPETGEYVENIATESGGSVKILPRHALLTFEPKASYIGPDHFNYSVCDMCDHRLSVSALTDVGCIKQVEQNNASAWFDGKHIACDHGRIEVFVLNTNEAPVLEDITAVTVQPDEVILQPFDGVLSGLTTNTVGIYDPDDIQAADLLARNEDLEFYHLTADTDIDITSTAIVTQPLMGSVYVEVSFDGLPQFKYTPSDKQQGYDSFIYKVCDHETAWKQSKCSWATARVHVTIPGPNITTLMASPAKGTIGDNNVHTDCKFSRGDTITVTFDKDTSMPPYHDTSTVLTTADLNALFEFGDPFIVNSKNANPYTGHWESAKELTITIVDEGYPQPDTEIGKWSLEVRPQSPCGGFDAISQQPLPHEQWSRYCLTTANFGSAHSQSVSSPLEGSWGYHMPSIKDIIIRNHNVPVSDLPDDGDYFGKHSELVLSLWPPVSYRQLVELCKLQASDILDLMVFGDDAELLKSSCDNIIPEGESADEDGVLTDAKRRKRSRVTIDGDMTKKDGSTNSRVARASDEDSADASSTTMPVFTELVFEVTRMSRTTMKPQTDRENFINIIKSSVKVDNIASIVSDTTGVSTEKTLNYTTNLIIPSETTELYQEYILDDTPQVVKVTASDPDNLDLVFGNGDVITIKFDRNTDTPSAKTKSELDKIFTFDPSLGSDYSGTWKTDQELEITITDASYQNRDNSEISNISFSFTHNMLYSGQEFTGQYPYLPTSIPNCVGINVCGGDEEVLTVGICNEDSLSCRATGTYYITDGDFGMGKPADSIWWIVLAMVSGILFLIIIIITCIFCCHKKKKSEDQELGDETTKFQPVSSTQDSWLSKPEKSLKEGRTAPTLIPPLILFKPTSQSRKVVDDVSKAEYRKQQVNVDSPKQHKKTDIRESDPTVPAMFPDIRTALLLHQSPNQGSKPSRELKDKETLTHNHHMAAKPNSKHVEKPLPHPHSPDKPHPKHLEQPLVRHNSEVDMSTPSKDEELIPHYKGWQKQSVGQPPPESDKKPAKLHQSKNNVPPNRRADPVHEALLAGHKNSLHNTSNAMSQTTTTSASSHLHSRSASMPDSAADSDAGTTSNTNHTTTDPLYRKFMPNHFRERRVSPSEEDISSTKVDSFGTRNGELHIETEAKKRDLLKGKSDSSLPSLDDYELRNLDRGSPQEYQLQTADSLHTILATQARQRDTSHF